MKSISLAIPVLVALAATRSAALAAPTEAPAPARAGDQEAKSLTLAELASRRDLWPPHVAVKEEMRFGGGQTVRAGQELVLHELTADSIVLDDGSSLFQCAPGETDVLERARAKVAKMTPEQLALTWDALRGRSELWPLRVALTKPISFANGVHLAAGREVTLCNWKGESMNLYDRQSSGPFEARPEETDVLDRGRARLAGEPGEGGEREPFFARALEAALEGGAGEGARPLDGVDLVLVYQGRHGCGRCAGFTPALKYFHRYASSAFDGLEVVYLPNDPTAQDARAHVREAGLPGRAVAWERRWEVTGLLDVPSEILPGAFVFDRSGTLLYRNDGNGGSPTPHDVLDWLEEHLRERAERTEAERE